MESNGPFQHQILPVYSLWQRPWLTPERRRRYYSGLHTETSSNVLTMVEIKGVLGISLACLSSCNV